MATNPRIALVTGGMGGLGEAICIKLAALGDKVVTTYSPGNTKAPEWLDAMKSRASTSAPTRATWPTGIRPPHACRRYPRKSGRSTCSSTTPESRAT